MEERKFSRRMRISNNNEYVVRLIEIASMYYEDRKTQEEIAQFLGLSNSMVSRMLSAAHQQGLIEVRIRTPIQTHPELQRMLVESFGLKAARVLVSRGMTLDQTLHGLGELGARFLNTCLHNDQVIAVSWGKSLCELVQALDNVPLHNVQVVQVSGSAGSRQPLTDGHELARLLAHKLNGTAHYLPAPMIVDEPLTRDQLLKDSSIRPVLDLAKNADLTLIGIGSPDVETSGFIRAGYLSAQALSSIARTGAVGDIFANFFDIYGQPVALDLSARHVGLNLDQLRRAKRVIAVAGGEYKASAILGALRLGCIDVLITDEAAAIKVLTLKDSLPRA